MKFVFKFSKLLVLILVHISDKFITRIIVNVQVYAATELIKSLPNMLNFLNINPLKSDCMFFSSCPLFTISAYLIHNFMAMNQATCSECDIICV
jgi:hypothetical protein